MSEELTVSRVAKAAGISRAQARLAIAAISGPTGGPNYTKRMGYLREAAESFGLNATLLSDATLEKRLRRHPRCAAMIDSAKEADAVSLSPAPGRG